MIYFDNSATSLQKPPEVAQAVTQAIASLGNAGRSFYTQALDAAREIYETRGEIAALTRLENPLDVAFTSGATESLNLVLDSLVTKEDHVITSVLEHNSVLRPLYKLKCDISFIPCGEDGRLELDHLYRLLKPNTKFLICTHGSNLTGTITDVKKINRFCKENGLLFILDVSQTLGNIQVDAQMADVLCFTGHKALYGPQGTGGIIANRKLAYKLVKTGGSGNSSFQPHQPLQMPDIFEAGTMNAHGLAGLRQGAAFVRRVGIDKIQKHEIQLLNEFINGVSKIPTVCIYRAERKKQEPDLPIVSLNVGGISSDEVAMRLWERYQIASRAGFHCAPLAHQHYKTQEQGMVRFSFGFFNTFDEIKTAVKALEEIAAQYR